MKHGVIYQSSGVEKNSEVKVAKNLALLKKIVRFVDKIGWGLAVVAGVFIFWLVGPVVGQEIKYAFGQTTAGRMVERVENTSADVVIVKTNENKLETNWLVPDKGYSIYIPKIMAKSNVIENVDPYNKSEYLAALQKGVAAAGGLAHPGEVGTTYLFAHSVGSRLDFARYNAIFYLLHRLEIGDNVEVVYKNKLYRYEVDQRLIVSASDMSFLAKQNDKEQLVMQTCYPPGTSWKRLIIVAKRV